MDEWRSVNNNCDGRPTAQFIAQTAAHQEENGTEFNFVRSGKSEAKVTNNRILHSTYCTVEANY